jgi:hypothetical protein
LAQAILWARGKKRKTFGKSGNDFPLFRFSGRDEKKNSSFVEFGIPYY